MVVSRPTLLMVERETRRLADGAGVERVAPCVTEARTDFDSKQHAQIVEHIAEARKPPITAGTSNVDGQAVFTY